MPFAAHSLARAVALSAVLLVGFGSGFSGPGSGAFAFAQHPPSERPKGVSRFACSGTVLDSSGATIAHATLVFEGPGGPVKVGTGATGGFRVTLPGDGSGFGRYTLAVTAPGFQGSVVNLAEEAGCNTPLLIHLEIARHAEQVDVDGDGAGSIQPSETQLGAVLDQQQV